MKADQWITYEDRLDRVARYIYDHLDQPLDLVTLAGVAALSPYHWHRIYHAVHGETIAVTVRRLRLQRAAVDLAQTSRGTEEIARRAGYGSEPAFARAFGEAYGLPPAQYRQAGSLIAFVPGRLEAPRPGWHVEVKHVSTTRLLTLEHRGPYIEIGRSFETLFGRAHASGLLPADIRMIGVFYDDPTVVPDDQLRARASVVADGTNNAIPPLELIEIGGGDCAVLRYQGPYADMRAAYVWLFGTWLPQSRREPADAPVFEEYLNSPRDTPPAQLLTELCLPLK
jgi:AraC family transcriptional regulator